MSEEEIRKWLRDRVSAPRFLHSVSVMETAAALARQHRVDEGPLRLAALLHDCARELTNEELLETSLKWGVPVRDVDRRSPVLLHGRLAARIAEEELGVTDPAVLSAVVWHTAGHPDMSISDKLFYLADVMEPTRRYDWVDDLREAAFDEIDRGVLMAIEINEEHLLRTGRIVDPDTYALKAALESRE